MRRLAGQIDGAGGLKVRCLLAIACLLAQAILGGMCAGAELQPLELLGVTKIWDRAPHNAFTDLVRWQGKFYCAFREGKGHAGDIGKLRIIVSSDGERWESAGLLAMDSYDLRDAALSVTPDGRLMVLGGVQQVRDGQRMTGTFVSFSADGSEYSAPRIVMPLGRWLWRVTWHGDTAYGVSYGTPNDRESSALHKTKDGIHYETVTDTLCNEGGWPTEARLRFAADGTCYCLHRRDGKQADSALLGSSQPPYTEWTWQDLGARLGGPNFLSLPHGQWVAAGRLYDGGPRTELVTMDPQQGQMTPWLRLPSGGDTSYPGMVWHDDILWVSYYSSHEEQTSIYLAKVRLPRESEKKQGTYIGNRLELFVDRHLIENMDGTELRMHAPRPAEAVVAFDKPWEGAFCGYATVIQDTDRLRMYYRGLPRAGRDGTDLEVTCYAESRDGIRWEKPNLGIYEIQGTRENNVVLSGHTPASHNFSPFLDGNPQAEASERFKALGGNSQGLLAFVSTDGIRWRRLRQQPVFTQGVFDSQNVAFYSSHEKCYVCYFRTWTKTNYGGFRSISRTTSTDFVHWSDPVPMSFGDTPWEHLYTNQTSPYFRAPHLYVAIAARFMPGRQVLSAEDAHQIEVDSDYFGDCSDAVLMTSRGGKQYDRTFMESFIRPGLGLQHWVSRTNYPALGIVPTGDSELSIYLQRNYGQPSAHLQRFTLRLDGFCSVRAGYAGGELITRPLIFSTGENSQVQLVLNQSTSAAGSLRVELQDAAGRALPGFSLEDCQPVIGDRIDRVVSWQGRSQLAELAGEPIRLRFELRDADLFSMQFR